MAEYIEERRTTDEGSFLNPFAIIIVLLLLAALAWWIFGAPRTADNTVPNNNSTVPSMTVPSTNSATPSGTP